MDCKKRKKVTTVYLPIADIICKLESENYSDIQFFSTPLFLRKPKKTAQIYLQIRETKKYLLINSLPVKINAKFRKDKIAPPLAPNLLIRSIIDINCFYFNILLFHASSFKIKKNAYVFIGQSGYGKSTIAKSTALDNLLGDDVAVIKKIKGNYYIFTSAFDFYKVGHLRYQQVLLNTIYTIKQAKKNIIRPLTAQDKILCLLENTAFFLFLETGMNNNVKYYDEYTKEKIVTLFYNLIMNLIEKIGIYQLQFTKDTRFLKKINQ
ncbi:MAG: hypothetical protein US54_C0071G0008 [Candidatus Roizmanbacteria bacterium GW2011_GWA2_37_7]|uniref:Uncharacterized protein n=1 Tax=Candidatus Roizmanbacteria bacterium GW2011_GWA2_37_7 TaxID=1618481 RepID=A0A0G0K6V7_9BACT|nr:MAG: hypothetical protein US54_C0071G0008 [Candidatus Roizmanbacteria bacterium GW2011_GWA2_37_7]